MLPLPWMGRLILWFLVCKWFFSIPIIFLGYHNHWPMCIISHDSSWILHLAISRKGTNPSHHPYDFQMFPNKNHPYFGVTPGYPHDNGNLLVALLPRSSSRDGKPVPGAQALGQHLLGHVEARHPNIFAVPKKNVEKCWWVDRAKLLIQYSHIHHAINSWAMISWRKQKKSTDDSFYKLLSPLWLILGIYSKLVHVCLKPSTVGYEWDMFNQQTVMGVKLKQQRKNGRVIEQLVDGYEWNADIFLKKPKV